ncbi:MAG: oligosaccharide flippase family protein [bacterium]|nr:oligosaccharide flippase family protein [bacterium]
MKALLKNTAIISIGSFFIALGNYAFHPIMARFLTVAEFGEFQALMALIYLIGIPAATIGLVTKKQTASYYGHDQLGKVRALRNWLDKVFILIGIAGILLILSLSNPITSFLKLTSNTPLLILGILFPLSLLQTIHASILEGLHRFPWSSLNGILATASKILLGGTLGYLGWGVSGALIAAISVGLIPFFLVLWETRDLPHHQTLDQAEKKKLLLYAIPTLLNVFCITMLYNWDLILVKHYLSPELAGQYGALALFGKIILFSSGPIVVALFPMAAAHQNQNRQLQLILQALFLTLLVGVTATTMFFILPNFLVSMLMGSSFSPIAPLLGLIGITFSFFSLNNILVQFFISTEKTRGAFILLLSITLMTAGISLFHGSLEEIIKVLLGIQAFTFILLLVYLFADRFQTPHESDFDPIPRL